MRTNASGRPLPSQTKCVFVVSPPRERPIAWSGGKSSGGSPEGKEPGRRKAVDAEELLDRMPEKGRKKDKKKPKR